MESLVHDKPRRQKTFAKHCQKGYVLGTSFKYYCAWIMWMKASRTTRILATVFHKHKYISNPVVSAADAVIAAASNLTAALRGKMPQHLKELSLDNLTCLSTIFSQASTGKATPQFKNLQPISPPMALPAMQQPRRSPRLATTVAKHGLIVAPPQSAIAAPKNPPIPPPCQNLIEPQPPSPGVLPPPPLSRWYVATPPAPRVETPRRSSRLAAKAPRVENIIDEENEIVEEERCTAPAYNTRIKKPTFGQLPKRQYCHVMTCLNSTCPHATSSANIFQWI